MGKKALDSFDHGVIQREIRTRMKNKELVRVRDVQDFIRTDMGKQVSWQTDRRALRESGFRYDIIIINYQQANGLPNKCTPQRRFSISGIFYHPYA